MIVIISLVVAAEVVIIIDVQPNERTRHRWDENAKLKKNDVKEFFSERRIHHS